MKHTLALLAMMISISLMLSAQAQQKVQITKAIPVISYEPAFYLEAGKDNVIRIKVDDSSVKRVLVNADHAKVKQEGEDFIVRPDSEGELTLKIYNYNDLSNPVLIEERKMEARTQAPAPVALLAGKSKGPISKRDLSEVKKVELSTTDPSLKVTEFRLSVAGKGIEYKEFSAKGEDLTSEMISQLQQLPTGCKIYVEYIRAGTRFTSRQLTPLSLVVGE